MLTQRFAFFPLKGGHGCFQRARATGGGAEGSSGQTTAETRPGVGCPETGCGAQAQGTGEVLPDSWGRG